MENWRALPKWGQRAFIIGGTVAVIALLALPEDKPAEKKEPTQASEPEKSRPRPHPTLTQNVRAAFNDTLDSKAGSSPRITRATCSKDGRCVVVYRTRPIALDGKREILTDQKQIWKRLFEDHRFFKATFIGTAELVSTGGKTSIGPVMKTTCDRVDNREIDWENVTPDGIEAICTVIPLVKLNL